MGLVDREELRKTHNGPERSCGFVGPAEIFNVGGIALVYSRFLSSVRMIERPMLE